MTEEEVISNLPYTVIGESSIPTPRHSILFTAEGLKAIAEKAKDGDMIRYEAWCDFKKKCEDVKHYSKWTIIRKEVKT